MKWFFIERIKFHKIFIKLDYFNKYFSQVFIVSYLSLIEFGQFIQSNLMKTKSIYRFHNNKNYIYIRQTYVQVEKRKEKDLVCKFSWCISVGSWRDLFRINGPARMKGVEFIYIYIYIRKE